MQIDERFVVPIPKTVQNGTVRRRNAWIRKAVLRSLWDARVKKMVEDGVDIFGVFTMTDCVEVNLKGDLEAPPAPESLVQYYRQYKEKGEDEDD